MAFPTVVGDVPTGSCASYVVLPNDLLIKRCGDVPPAGWTRMTGDLEGLCWYRVMPGDQTVWRADELAYPPIRGLA